MVPGSSLPLGGGVPIIYAAASFAVGIPDVLFKFLPTLT